MFPRGLYGRGLSCLFETNGRAKMTLKIERFQPEGMNVRISNGQPSYSHVVTVSGAGKIVYTAGQLARDIDGNCVGKGDMRAQLEQTFQNLTAASRPPARPGPTSSRPTHSSPTSTNSRSALTCACATSVWRPRPARLTASPALPVPISWSRSRPWLSSIREGIRSLGPVDRLGNYFLARVRRSPLGVRQSGPLGHSRRSI